MCLQGALRKTRVADVWRLESGKEWIDARTMPEFGEVERRLRRRQAGGLPDDYNHIASGLSNSSRAINSKKHCYQSSKWKAMPIYHVVLFKLKPGVTSAQLAEWTSLAKSMVGKIPGLTKLEANGPLPLTADRGKDFNYGLIAILEKAEDIKIYAAHPAHLEVHKFREALCDDTLAYDLEYPA